MAYEMYAQGIVKTPADVAKIWYDTIPYLTGESRYYDMRIYVEEIMKERGYSKSDIAKVDKIFEDANFTVEAMNKYPIDVVEKDRPENNMDPNFGTYDPTKQTAFDNRNKSGGQSNLTDDQIAAIDAIVDAINNLTSAAKVKTDTQDQAGTEYMAAGEAAGVETEAAKETASEEAEETEALAAETEADAEKGADVGTETAADASPEADQASDAASETGADQEASAAEADGAQESGGAESEAASGQTEDSAPDYDSPAETDTADYAAADENPAEYDAAADDTSDCQSSEICDTFTEPEPDYDQDYSEDYADYETSEIEADYTEETDLTEALAEEAA